MRSEISALARHWLRQVELGRGIRLTGDQLDLLNSIGVGELIAKKASEEQRAISLKRSSTKASQIG